MSAGAWLIDVRDPSEHEQGSLPGARNVPLGDLRGRVAELRQSDRPLVLFCQSGGRSRIAAGLLAQAGVCGIHDLGGIDRWDEGSP